MRISVTIDGQEIEVTPFDNYKVHTLMYQLDNNSKSVPQQEPVLQMTVVKSEQLSEMVDFAKTNTGAPEQWLTGYYTNLINR